MRQTLISKLLTLLRLTVNSIETLSPFYDRLPTGHQRKTISISHKSSTYYRGYFETLCASIYHEVRWKEAILKTEERSRDTGEKDIYIEQCYICGILGYHKFLSLDRLQTFLGWQPPIGCYGENARNQGDMLQQDRINNEDSHQGLVDHVHSNSLSAGRSRRQTSRDLPGNLSF